MEDFTIRQAFRLIYGEGSGDKVEVDYRLFKAGWVAASRELNITKLSEQIRGVGNEANN